MSQQLSLNDLIPNPAAPVSYEDACVLTDEDLQRMADNMRPTSTYIEEPDDGESDPITPTREEDHAMSPCSSCKHCWRIERFATSHPTLHGSPLVELRCTHDPNRTIEITTPVLSCSRYFHLPDVAEQARLDEEYAAFKAEINATFDEPPKADPTPPPPSSEPSQAEQLADQLVREALAWAIGKGFDIINKYGVNR